MRPFSEGLALVATTKAGSPDRRCGFIDRAGGVAIPLDYEDAFWFSCGLAAVRVDGKWGFINKSGKFVIAPRFTRGSWFEEDLAAVALDDGGSMRSGFINKAGELVIELDGYRSLGDFSSGRALVVNKLTGLYGFIDQSGDFAIPATLYGAQPFSEGLAAVQVEKDGKWGYTDRQGEIVVLPQFDHVGDFNEGMADFTLGGRQGYIAKAK